MLTCGFSGLQAGSVNLAMWTVARVINGFGVGIVTSVAPTLMVSPTSLTTEFSQTANQGELASPRWRGRLMVSPLLIQVCGAYKIE